jgi:hypothetical protein
MFSVRAGGGLSVLPDFLVADELESSRLIHVLPEWALPSGDMYTVYPAARFRPRKVIAFVEMLIAAVRQKGSHHCCVGRVLKTTRCLIAAAKADGSTRFDSGGALIRVAASLGGTR